MNKGDKKLGARKNMAEQLSQAVSIEEVVIETVAEMCKRKVEETSAAFSESDTSNHLFNFETGYYLNDIHLIIADFAGECVRNLGWKIY